MKTPIPFEKVQQSLYIYIYIFGFTYKCMQRRKFLAGTGLAATTFLAGCSGESDTNDGGNEDNSDGSSDNGGNDGAESDGGEDENGSEQESADEPDLMEFSGSGTDVTDEFDLNGGFVAVEASHTGGESNFQVELVDENGEMAALFVNSIGEFDGEVGASPEAGSYVLDINADGDWDITLRQPRPTEGDSPPVEESGDSPSVLGPYEFGGRVQATGSYDGQGNFIVEAYPVDPGFQELVFNEIDSFEGSNTFSMNGLGFVVVQASGSWTLEME